MWCWWRLRPGAYQASICFSRLLASQLHKSPRMLRKDVECSMVGSLNGIRIYFFGWYFFLQKRWECRCSNCWRCFFELGLSDLEVNDDVKGQQQNCQACEFSCLFGVYDEWIEKSNPRLVNHLTMVKIRLWMGYYCWWFRNPAPPEMQKNSEIQG